MRQTYKINIDGKALILLHDDLLSEYGTGNNQLALPYRGIKNTLFQYLDTLEKSNRFESILLYTNDVLSLFEDLKSITLWTPAAGGVIENSEGKILLIFRRGYWDLPKGKKDPKETSKETAIRECEEETGIHPVILQKKINETWHLYREKDGQRALKRTKWFAMQYPGTQTPVPQTEEGISEIIWINPELASQKTPMYQNIKTVIESFLDYKMNNERQIPLG